MILPNMLLLFVLSTAGAQTGAPRCQPQPGRKAEQIQGEVRRGDRFSRMTPAGWILRLVPGPEGWFLEVTTKDWAPAESAFYMLYCYAKNDQGDLTPAQAKALGRLVREEFK